MSIAIHIFAMIVLYNWMPLNLTSVKSKLMMEFRDISMVGPKNNSVYLLGKMRIKNIKYFKLR